MQDDRENEDPILDIAIHYVLQREYPDAELTKDQKRAVRKPCWLIREKCTYKEKVERLRSLVQLRSRGGSYTSLPLRCHFRPFWCYQDSPKSWKGIVSDVREFSIEILC